MNNQLTELEQVDPMEHALTLTIAAFDAVTAANNNSVIKHNLQVDKLERMGNENTFLKLQIKTLQNRIDDVAHQNERLLEARKNDEKKEKLFNKTAETIQANAEKHMQQLNQAQRQEQQAKNKLDEAVFTVAKYKELGSPKQIREKNKKYQATITTLQADKVQLKLSIKNYRYDLTVKDKTITEKNREIAENGFQKFYNKNGDNLMVYPLLCEAIGDGKTEKQVPIWYSTDSGIGALYMLNEDGEPARSPTPKTGIKPKAETMDLIGTMLRKFKRNGNVVYAEDIQLLKCC